MIPKPRAPRWQVGAEAGNPTEDTLPLLNTENAKAGDMLPLVAVTGWRYML